MRKLLIVALSVLSPLLSQGQATLEQSYLSAPYAGLTLVSDNTYKYYTYDANDMYVVTLRNLDHSVWKTITLPSYTGVYAVEVKSVTEKLFNTDSQVELLVHYWYGNGGHPLQLISESGTVLQNFGTVNSHVLTNTDAGPRLLTYRPVIGQSMHYTDIYALPGTMPCGECGNGLGVAKVAAAEQIDLSDPVPNPANNEVLISYQLKTAKSGEIMFYNASGQLIRTQSVDQSGNCRVSTKDMPAGTYWYYITTGDGRSSGRKMVVLH
jgi:hypothetical protein